MFDLKKVTLFTLYAPWDKSKISSSDFQDGERQKVVNEGVEKTIKALYTSMDGIEYGSVKFVTTKQVVDQRGEELLKEGITCEECHIPKCSSGYNTLGVKSRKPFRRVSLKI